METVLQLGLPICRCVKLLTTEGDYGSCFLRGTAMCLSITAESDHFPEKKKMSGGIFLRSVYLMPIKNVQIEEYCSGLNKNASLQAHMFKYVVLSW